MPTRPRTHRPPSLARGSGRRASAARRGYGRAWQRASKAFLAEHPLCAECERQGRVKAASVVDHVIPHKGDMELFWDSEHNWRALCVCCHNIKTASRDGGLGRPVRHVASE